jgi:hypothetical protein
MNAKTKKERLLHYSKEPLTEVRSCAQNEHDDPSKPRGLWVSVEGPDDWKAWCHSEEHHIDRLLIETEVVLASEARILRLSSAFGLDAFTKQYEHCAGMIDWAAVAREHQVIIIAPYCWERRLELICYYGWDCASGVIWDAAAIAGINRGA